MAHTSAAEAFSEIATIFDDVILPALDEILSEYGYEIHPTDLDTVKRMYDLGECLSQRFTERAEDCMAFEEDSAE